MRSSPLGGDGLRQIETLHTGGDAAGMAAQHQLTVTTDVKAAHAFFQPTGGEVHLPAVTGFTGGEANTAHAVFKAAEGTVMAATHMAGKLGESVAMSAAQQAGSQVISPLIQMIMRMPGHIGLMSSFFEAFSKFFLGPDILGALDPTHLLAQSAESTMHAFQHALEGSIGGSMGAMHIDLSSLHMPDMFSGSHNAMFHSMEGLSNASVDLKQLGLHNVELTGQDTVSPSANIPTQSDFMQRDLSSSNLGDASNNPLHLPGVTDPQRLLSDAGAATFRPSMGGLQQPINNVQLPQSGSPVHQQPLNLNGTTPAQPASHVLPKHLAPAEHATASDAGAAKQLEAQNHATSHADAVHHTDSHVSHVKAAIPKPQHAIEHVSETPHEQAPATESVQQPNALDQATNTTDGAHAAASQPTEYTVQHGDNLWNIAKSHLGDGSKWNEIYDLNRDVLGSNPGMIHTGLKLQLPGSDIASADYVVKPGDNLWTISQSHMGGGQNWSEIYHANESVIGSNPAVIHPGQHFTLSGGHADQSVVAHSAASAPTHVAHAAPVNHTAVAHSVPQAAAPHAAPVQEHPLAHNLASADTVAPVTSTPQAFQPHTLLHHADVSAHPIQVASSQAHAPQIDTVAPAQVNSPYTLSVPQGLQSSSFGGPSSGGEAVKFTQSAAPVRIEMPQASAPGSPFWRPEPQLQNSH